MPQVRLPARRAHHRSQDRSVAHLQARRCDEGHSGQEEGRGRRGASRAHAGQAGRPACAAGQARGAPRARRAPGCSRSSRAPGATQDCSAAAAGPADHCTTPCSSGHCQPSSVRRCRGQAARRRGTGRAPGDCGCAASGRCRQAPRSSSCTRREARNCEAACSS